MIKKTKGEVKQNSMIRKFKKEMRKSKKKPKRKKEKKYDSFQQQLYDNRTKSERMLSNALSKEGIYFKEQYPINCGNKTYYLDFYIETRSDRWAIELDGYYHTTEEGKSKDKKRTKALYNIHGIRTMRFFNPNKSKLDEVVNEICKLNPYLA